MNFHHSGSLGDVVYSIPTILSLSQGSRANLYLRPGVKAGFDKRRNHPNGNVRMTEAGAQSLINLVKSQPAFDEVGLFADQPIDIDLDLMRQVPFDFSKGCIQRWYFYAYEANYDLSQPWLWVEPNPKYNNRLVVNRTLGYRNPWINYKCLDPYRPVFLGLPSEYDDFVKACPSAEYVPTQDLLEVARIIQASQCYIGNQSVGYAMAEALKVPRLLEVCLYCPNVIPMGLTGWDCINQVGFDVLSKRLLG